MSLVAHYKFENNIKNELQGYTTTSGSLTFNSDGIVDYSAVFNGSTYITFDSTFYLNHNADWTVSVWIKTTSTNTMSILSNSSGGPVHNDLRIQSGKITYFHYNGSWYTKQGSTLVNDGRWHNLTWVNFSHSRMNMYVDGVLDLSMADSTMSAGGAINRIGYNWGGNAFIGEMDEFKIYNDSSLFRINELAFNQGLVRHWPMLGNLSDYSGYNKDLINSTGTNTSTSGKIGLGLTKTSGYYSSGMTIIPDEVTISLWFRHNGTNWLSECLFGTRTSSNGFMLYRNDGDTDGYYRAYFWYNTTSNTVAGYNTWPGISGLSANTWYHITMVRKSNGNLRLYKDGQIVYNGSKPSNFSSWHNNGATLSFHGQGNGSGYTDGDITFNDIRVYNYGLSDKEVYELSKGKVVHYKFNNPYEEPTENLANTPWDITQTWSSVRTNTKETSFLPEEHQNSGLNGYRLSSSTNASTWSGNAYTYTYFDKSVTNGAQYTFSAWVYASYDCNLTWARISYENASGGATYYDMTKKGTWQKLTLTTTMSGTTLRALYYTHIANTTSYSVMKGYVIFCAPQLEKKSYATPFVDGLRKAYAVDSSGFQNSSEYNLLYSPTWEEDKKLGFGSNKYQATRTLLNKNLNVTHQLTLACWFKMDTVRESGLIQSDFYLSVHPDGRLRAYWYGTSSPGYHYGTTYCQANTWYHAAAVWNGTQCKIYLNGNLETTVSTNTPGRSTNGYVAIGTEDSNWPPTSSRQIHGNIDDVRIYATALSSDDIENLYSLRGSIDNSGKIHGNEIVELNDYGIDINNSIVARSFSNGLSSYQQTYMTVSLTEDGVRLYRPPNVGTGSTWGGLVLFLPEEAKQIGRTYRVMFKIKGDTARNMSDRRFSYTVGWGSYGIGLPSHGGTAQTLSNMAGFGNSDYQDFIWDYTVESNRFDFGEWTVSVTSGSNVATYTNKHPSAPNVVNGDMIVTNSYFPNFTTITSVTSNSSFTLSNNATQTGTFNLNTYRTWDTYNQLKFGFSYETTLSGTDLYIKDLKVIDITDHNPKTIINSDGNIVLNNINTQEKDISIQVLADNTFKMKSISEVD